VADCGEELDVDAGQPVGMAGFTPVHGLKLLLVALQEA